MVSDEKIPGPGSDQPDWTVSTDGRSNSSAYFLSLVDEVARMVSNARVGDSGESVARLILAQLAHVHGIVPRPSAAPAPVCPKHPDADLCCAECWPASSLNKRPDRLIEAARAVWKDAEPVEEQGVHVVTTHLLRELDWALSAAEAAPCASSTKIAISDEWVANASKPSPLDEADLSSVGRPRPSEAPLLEPGDKVMYAGREQTVVHVRRAPRTGDASPYDEYDPVLAAWRERIVRVWPDWSARDRSITEDAFHAGWMAHRRADSRRSEAPRPHNTAHCDQRHPEKGTSCMVGAAPHCVHSDGFAAWGTPVVPPYEPCSADVQADVGDVVEVLIGIRKGAIGVVDSRIPTDPPYVRFAVLLRDEEEGLPYMPSELRVVEKRRRERAPQVEGCCWESDGDMSRVCERGVKGCSRVHVATPRESERSKYPLGECCIAGRCDGERCPCACHPEKTSPSAGPNAGLDPRVQCLACGADAEPWWREDMVEANCPHCGALVTPVAIPVATWTDNHHDAQAWLSEHMGAGDAGDTAMVDALAALLRRVREEAAKDAVGEDTCPECQGLGGDIDGKRCRTCNANGVVSAALSVGPDAKEKK